MPINPRQGLNSSIIVMARKRSVNNGGGGAGGAATHNNMNNFNFTSNQARYNGYSGYLMGMQQKATAAAVAAAAAAAANDNSFVKNHNQVGVPKITFFSAQEFSTSLFFAFAKGGTLRSIEQFRIQLPVHSSSSFFF